MRSEAGFLKGCRLEGWCGNAEGGTSLAVQGFGLGGSTAGDTGSIPGRGTKIPHVTWCADKKLNKERKEKEMLTERKEGQFREEGCQDQGLGG